MSSDSIIALLSGPDQPGLVSRVSSWIFLRGGNIKHADQHKDTEANIFFQRVEWLPSAGNLNDEAGAFKQFASEELGMQVEVALSTDRPKVALFVSKFDHCFHDTILRFKAGEMFGELACVISNHDQLKAASMGYDIPFYQVPVSADSKADAEARQMDIIRQHDIRLVVLARYAGSFRRVSSAA